MTKRGKGFRQLEDKRDFDFPLSELLAAAPSPLHRIVSKNWKTGKVLDQGSTSSCVGHGCYQLLTSEPFLHETAGLLSPFDIYDGAQAIDEFPDGTEGTSVRAGMKVLQGLGFISAYHWAASVDDMVDYLTKVGPLVVGTSWLSGMDRMDDKGVVRATGRDAGGHCYVAHAANTKEELFTFINSWGGAYGKKGHARISFSDFAKLLSMGGVACAAVEIPSS